MAQLDGQCGDGRFHALGSPVQGIGPSPRLKFLYQLISVDDAEDTRRRLGLVLIFRERWGTKSQYAKGLKIYAISRNNL